MQAAVPGIEVTVHIEPIEERASWEDSALLALEEIKLAGKTQQDALAIWGELEAGKAANTDAHAFAGRFFLGAEAIRRSLFPDPPHGATDGFNRPAVIP